jgi:methylglutaconyl-CoA hydratase
MSQYAKQNSAYFECRFFDVSIDTVVTTIDRLGVATVTLNNPGRHNAFDDKTIAELQLAFEAVASNPDIRVMLLTAQGASFSAGADLGWMKRMANYSYEENLSDARKLANMLRTLNYLPKPTIARVQGAAFGGALGLISCCDMAVASTRATFSLSEVKIGLAPATIAPYVVAAIGPRASRRLFQTAERFSAEEARMIGLVDRVVEESMLDDSINISVKAILANSPSAMMAAKRLVFDVSNRELSDELVEETCELIARLRVSDEGQEGLEAFLQKRRPSYSKQRGNS